MREACDRDAFRMPLLPIPCRRHPRRRAPDGLRGDSRSPGFIDCVNSRLGSAGGTAACDVPSRLIRREPNPPAGVKVTAVRAVADRPAVAALD
jgi:hypothetical protein